MITVLANEAIITILEHFRNSSGEKELEPELSIALHTLEEKIKVTPHKYKIHFSRQ